MARLLSILFIIVLMGGGLWMQTAFLAGDQFHDERNSIEFDQDYSGKAFVRISDRTLEPLNSRYVVDEPVFKRKVSTAILHQRYLEDKATNRWEPEEDTAYRPNLSPTVAHIEKARDLGVGQIERYADPTHVAAMALTAGTPAGAALQLYTTVQSGITILRISEQLEKANSDAEAELNKTMASLNESAPPPSVTSIRRSYSTALDGVIYYNYVIEYGSEEQASKAEAQLQGIQSGMEIVSESRETPFGYFTYETVRWGDPAATISAPYYTLTRVEAFSEFELPPRYYAKAYQNVNQDKFEDSLRNHVLDYNGAEGAMRFLDEGGHCVDTVNEAKDNCEETLILRELDVRSADPATPKRMQVEAIELSKKEVEQLEAMNAYATARSEETSTLSARLTEQKRRYTWEPLDTNHPAFWHAPPFETKIADAERRLAYTETVLEGVRSYHPDAVRTIDGDYYYVDTAPRVAAVANLTEVFDSSRQFESHIETQLETTEQDIVAMEQWGRDGSLTFQLRLFGARYLHYVHTAFLGDSHGQSPDEKPDTLADMVAAPTPLNAGLLVLFNLPIAILLLLIVIVVGWSLGAAVVGPLMQ